MHTILTYEIEKEIYESANSIVYRAKKKDVANSEQRIILKQLRKEFPTPEEIVRFTREFEITRSLKYDSIIKVYELSKYQNSYVMTLEDFEGEAIANYLLSNQFTVNQFLPLAIQIAESLAFVHSKKIIHKDINPTNIVWNPKTKKVKLIDFGISSELSHETASLRNINVLEGTLNYMSPEQTGRMNRAMDYRTDLYSLGATFYQMLTGQVPFSGGDAMEIVHGHIAKDPIAPHEINREIPEVLSEIILRLMAKMAENRYQTAIGLVHDLKWCLENIESLRAGRDLFLKIGANDISDRFEIPQKLYGRQIEVEALMNAFDRIKENTKEIMLIRGYSGIGKSALVQEIYKPIVERKGSFIRGKFDQYKRNIPYASLVQAFQELVKQILTESKEELAVRREQILAALAQNSSVIVDVIPEVGLIIGEQAPARILSPEESRNRFNLIFRNFVRVFTSGKNPLVIFLDDLQWADLPSLHLLELIVTDPEIGNLLVIGAYRDNEVDPTHPLLATLAEIENKKVTVNIITLSSLNLYHVSQLVADTLLVPQVESNELASLCFEKTQGNPFFLNQFLSMLYQENLILFDPIQLKWKWGINEIQKRGITDNVVDLMANKIKKLPEITQNILRLAACIGNQFDLRTLATVNEKSLSRTAVDLWDALKEGLIIPTTETYNLVGQNSDTPEFESIIPAYRFLHDRVQQAAYSLIIQEDRKKIHLKVGKLLLEKSSKEIQEDNLFDIVNHLNMGMDLISEELERERLIELNLSVSKKAKLSAAYEPAYSYAKNALNLLPENTWTIKSGLALKVHIEAAETAYLSGKFESMEQILEVILAHDIELIDKAKVYEIKMQAFIAMHNSLEAVKTALQVLRLLGLELSENPTQEEIGKELGETMQALSKYQISDLLKLPVMEDPEKIAAMRILELTFSPCFQTNPSLFPILVFRMTQLSLKYGNTSTSALAYSCYGLILCGIVCDIDSGYQFGQLALKLIDALQNEEHKPNTVYNVTIFVTHWKEPVRNTIKPFLEAYQLGMIVGDFEFGSWSAMYYGVHSYFAGKKLPEIIEETAKFRKAIQDIKQETAFKQISMFLQVLLNLSSGKENPWILVGDVYNEEEMLPVHQKANDNTALCFIYFHKLILCYLLGEQDLAIKNMEMTAQYITSVPSTFYGVLFHFYDSLTQLAHYPHSEEKESILAKVNANQTKMKTWADHCAANCLHKYYLVEAEKARVLGEDWQAVDFYDKASKLAKQNEFLQEEALVSELYAQFWISRDKAEFAQMLLNKTYYLYSLWGAKTKTTQLENKYGHFIRKQSKTNKIGNKNTTFSSLEENVSSLDLVSVMKASQTISQEIVIDQLLKKMMHTVIENAGAETGVLLKEKNGKWVIEADGEFNKEHAPYLQTHSLKSLETGLFVVPVSIIQYVARTKESVVLDNASKEGNFISDPYIVQKEPKSILCSAILHHGEITGILYLENNSISGAFTKDRLEVLQILSSQAAISLENASLYANLEEKVVERTAQLEEAHKKILVLEKETTEKQLAGGFAHEMRNALVGPKLVIQHILGQDGNEPFESISLKSNRKLKEIYLLIKDIVPSDTLETTLMAMKEIFQNEEQIDSSLNMIYKAVSKGLNITQLIMDYSKVGNERTGKQLVDLNLLLQNIVEEYKKDWANYKIIFHLDMTKEKTQVLGLETHIESVYKNLLLNAKDALLDKTLTNAKEKAIEVKTRVARNSFLVEITDNGTGISNENLGKIYDAFFSTKPDTGMGLGLGVVKKIINLYSGKIEVKSELGKGTTFIVTIPLQ
jgi:predicted ATPase/signal transduction histidine kinase/tRNA A-37 threonylcarbamoyl transferase component Bud32